MADPPSGAKSSPPNHLPTPRHFGTTTKKDIAVNSLLYRLLKLPNYWRAFSRIEAIRLLLNNEFSLAPRTQDGLLKLRLSGLGITVFLRKNRSDRAIFWQCLVMRQYDLRPFPSHNKAMQRRYRALVEEGKTPLIIDCGGNIGLSSIWFANTFPKAQIIAVEPDATNFQLLKTNISPYSDRIRPVFGGVWPRHERLHMREKGRGGAGASVTTMENNATEDSVSAYTIDDLLRMTPSAVPFFIKIDIEGAQKHLFSENTDWTERFPCLSLELEDWLLPWQGTSTNFLSCMSKKRMDYLIKGENIFCFNHELNQPKTPQVT